MIRGVFALTSRIALSSAPKTLHNSLITKPVAHQQNASFTSISPIPSLQWINKYTKGLLNPQKATLEQTRTVTKYSLKTGKRKSVGAVIKRFYRLNWGIWIRTIAGRHKKLWKKKGKNKNALLNHVFVNATQTKMLDKMVTYFWKKPKYYIDDPYGAYHNRENFSITKKKPWRPEGVDYE